MDDRTLHEIQSRNYVIVAPERSPIKNAIFLIASCCLITLTIAALALFFNFATGQDDRNASVAHLQPLQGTPIVLVGNWPQDRTPTPTEAPSPSPTLSPVQQVAIADLTKRAQPTPDPRWSMPFCNDSTTLPLTPCLPYAVTTPTPQATPTPLSICTDEDFHQDAANMQPCLKSPHSATPNAGAPPTPTFAVPTPYTPVANSMGPSVAKHLPNN